MEVRASEGRDEKVCWVFRHKFVLIVTMVLTVNVFFAEAFKHN